MLSGPDCESPDLACVDLLVARALISSLVTSPVFPLLVTTLTEHDELAQAAVSQLQQAGHQVQAASLEVETETLYFFNVMFVIRELGVVFPRV